MKRVLFSDFDGTLSQGQIGMEFLDYLHENDLHDRQCYQQQQSLVIDCKNGKISHNEWIDQWAYVWAEGLKGFDERRIADAAQNFYSGFKHNIYDSSFAIREHFNGIGLVLISVGPYEVIDLASKDLDMGETIATKCEIKDSVYTGNILTGLHTPTGKAEALRDYAREHGTDLKCAIAFGDSAHDLSMLSVVGNPVVVNPSKELEKIANERNWPVRNKDNIIAWCEAWAV